MADPEGRKRARLLKSGRTIRVTKPTLLCQRVGTFGGFLPKKKPAQSGAGRVGEGSHRAALKARNPPGGFRRAYFCTLIITQILQREGENVNGLHYAHQNPLTTAVKAVVAREAAAPSAGGAK